MSRTPTSATTATDAIAARPDRLAEAIADRGLDALLVTDLVNVRWLTGFTGSNAAAVVGAGPEGVRRFVTDFRYLTQSAEQLDGRWTREIHRDLLTGFVAQLPAEGTLRLGFDDAKLSVREHRRLGTLVREDVELVAAGGAVEALRLIKDEAELDPIRAAAALGDAALEEVL